jgi:hypothetical protein
VKTSKTCLPDGNWHIPKDGIMVNDTLHTYAVCKKQSRKVLQKTIPLLIIYEIHILQNSLLISMHINRRITRYIDITDKWRPDPGDLETGCSGDKPFKSDVSIPLARRLYCVQVRKSKN